MSADTSVLEMTFVHLYDAAEMTDGDIWQEVDEQHLPADLRRRLASNGFRCGVVGMQLPPLLRRNLDKRIPTTDARTTGGTVVGAGNIDETSVRRRLQSRAGQRSEIQASSVHDRLTVLVLDEDRITGAPYRRAQCIFALKTRPEPGGRIQLDIVPEIHHGDAKQNWIGRDGMFQGYAQREREVLEQLRIVAHLAPGETLLLGCTDPVKGLGKQCFTDADGDDPGLRRLLLIRLEQTQHDELFDSMNPSAVQDQFNASILPAAPNPVSFTR
jgi:hypothetical protein